MAVRFPPNLPVYLLFPCQGFLPVDGLYGTQYLYQVEVNGQRDRLYAGPKLHRALQLARIASGRVYRVTQVPGRGRRKEWLVRPALAQAISAAPVPRPDQRTVAAVVSRVAQPAPAPTPAFESSACNPEPLDRLLRLPLPLAHRVGQSGGAGPQGRPTGPAADLGSLHPPRRRRPPAVSSRDAVQSGLPF